MNTQELKNLAKDTLDDWKRDCPTATIENIINDERGAWTGSDRDFEDFVGWLDFYHRNGYKNN